MSHIFDKKLLDTFQDAVQSLKLYRRADLIDENTNDPLIESLYVDPLPNEHVFKTLLKANTTFLIGRKGTGKSTLFQRLQSEVRKKKNQTSAYIDIKTVFESSLVDLNLSNKLKDLPTALPIESLEKLLLYREFIHAVIYEIKKEVQKKIESSFWQKVKESFVGTNKDLFEGLDILLEDVKQDKFFSILGIYTQNITGKQGTTTTDKDNAGAKITLSKDPSASFELSDSSESKTDKAKEIQYSDVLIRSFDVKQIIVQLKSILEKAKIRNLYILLDDFSELPDDAMQIVVDVLLTPLNNWSDEFIKFKIAAYPGRIYFGQIDKSKVDEVYLDLYKLYGGGDVGRMEESAIDFTKRLIESRINFYCKIPFSVFFEGDLELWQDFFYASMANPRILGYLLHYIHESHLIRGKKINSTAIREAAERYYEEKIESYFTIGKFLHESFEERSSIFSLKELIESIVARAKELRSHDSQVIRKINGRPPTSHFHVPVIYESLFNSLELNFFVTKYFEMSDRTGRKVSIYALNYGLCAKYTIRFGRPVGEREFRLYFVERFFDYSSIILSYLSKNQEIVCENCGFKYAFEHIEALRFYNMQCKECQKGKVIVQNLSRKYAEELGSVSENLLLPHTELGILQALHTENSPLRPNVIAAELDCSYQLVGKRARNLDELGLIRRSTIQNQRFYELDKKAEEAYFKDSQKEELNIPKEDLFDKDGDVKSNNNK
jgi:DNA-binding MarR family transcriptional regulator